MPKRCNRNFLSTMAGCNAVIPCGTQCRHTMRDAVLPSQNNSMLGPRRWLQQNIPTSKCAVARGSHFGDRLSLKQYVAAMHVAVSPLADVQTIPDKRRPTAICLNTTFLLLRSRACHRSWAWGWSRACRRSWSWTWLGCRGWSRGRRWRWTLATRLSDVQRIGGVIGEKYPIR